MSADAPSNTASADVDAPEADARASELHAEMVEEWPLLAGTNDAALPRVIASETTIGQNLETTWEMRHVRTAR